jgi:hypothetical protein
MAAVVQGVHPMLKSRGFRKRRHNFNRTTEDGVIEVINFQMGPNEQFGDYSLEAMRHGLYGQFTVNLGVIFEDVNLFRFSRPPRPFYSYPDASGPSARLGSLVSDRDVWWPLVGDPAEVAASMRSEFEHYALPWLETLNNRAKLLTAWRSGIFDDMRSSFPMAPLSVDIVCWRSGDTSSARTIIAEYLRTDLSAYERSHVSEVAEGLGLCG